MLPWNEDKTFTLGMLNMPAYFKDILNTKHYTLTIISFRNTSRLRENVWLRL